MFLPPQGGISTSLSWLPAMMKGKEKEAPVARTSKPVRNFGKNYFRRSPGITDRRSAASARLVQGRMHPAPMLILDPVGEEPLTQDFKSTVDATDFVELGNGSPTGHGQVASGASAGQAQEQVW